jgi:hypothetical protein
MLTAEPKAARVRGHAERRMSRATSDFAGMIARIGLAKLGLWTRLRARQAVKRSVIQGLQMRGDFG